MASGKEESSVLSILGMQNADSQDSNEQDRNEGNNNQGVPLTPNERQQSREINQHIQKFEESLDQLSNSELKKTAEQLETVEREMLMEKIDNELETIKETVVQPGNAAAGASVAKKVAEQAPIDIPVH